MTGQMFLITTQDSAAILPTLERASNYMLGIIEEVIENGRQADLRIRTRSAHECKQFLDGQAPALQPAAPAKQPQKEASAKKAAKATAKPEKAAGGGQTVPKADKPTAPAKVKTGSNRSLVLAFINACTRDTAVDLKQICKATKLQIASVSPMLTELYKAGLIDRVEGKPLRFFKRSGTTAAPQPDKNQIMCKARGRVIAIDTCKPNDASPVCRDCPNIEH